MPDAIIHISFKETKASSWEECRRKIRWAIRSLYEKHQSALERRLEGATLKDFRAILNDSAHDVEFQLSLGRLTEHLHKVHGTRPIVLIDEYDAGIHGSYANGFYKEAVGFFGGFFLAGLKDNPDLERGVMTGILRVSRESIFSDLNNVGVYSLLRSEFATCFGFTEDEVKALLEKVGWGDLIDAVRSYYDGYDFGMVHIYNPWSILNFLASNERDLVAHWVGTSSNTLIKELLQHHAFKIQEDVRTLLEGGTIEKDIDENVAFPELKENESALWNLLVFSGYLKAARPGPVVVGEPRPPFRLSIPNREVAEVYRTTFQAWMNRGLTSQGSHLNELLTAVLEGNAHKFETQLQKFASTMPSYHDVEGVEPEKFYHGMMIGLLAGLEPDYEVRSNRESGKGRPDVLIRPRRVGKPGVVLELKSARVGEKSIEQAMGEGLTQLEANDYAAELRVAGVERIQQMVVGFDGKRVMVLPKGAPRPKRKRGTIKKVGETIRRAAKKVAAKVTKKATKTTKR